MLQFTIAILDTNTNTGLQLLCSFTKQFAVKCKHFDKIILDRMRARGYMIRFGFLDLIFSEIYLDGSDVEIRDTENYNNSIEYSYE